MALPPKARAKRGNASKYCCGSGHAQRQGGSLPKANVSTARHRSASAAVAVRINASDMISSLLLLHWCRLSTTSRWVSGTAESGSKGRADAGSHRLHPHLYSRFGRATRHVGKDGSYRERTTPLPDWRRTVK